MTSSNPFNIIDNRQLPALNLNYKEYNMFLQEKLVNMYNKQILITKL